MIAASIEDYQQVHGLSVQLKNYIAGALAITQKNPDDGRYDIDGDNIFLLISSPSTEPKSSRLAEIHHRYLDVQILLEGAEILGYGLQQTHEKPDDDRLSAQDIAFFKTIPHEQFLNFKPGNFVVFFPRELHRPLCAVNENPQRIKKAVLKVNMDILR